MSSSSVSLVPHGSPLGPYKRSTKFLATPSRYGRTGSAGAFEILERAILGTFRREGEMGCLRQAIITGDHPANPENFHPSASVNLGKARPNPLHGYRSLSLSPTALKLACKPCRTPDVHAETHVGLTPRRSPR